MGVGDGFAATNYLSFGKDKVEIVPCEIGMPSRVASRQTSIQHTLWTETKGELLRLSQLNEDVEMKMRAMIGHFAF